MNIVITGSYTVICTFRDIYRVNADKKTLIWCTGWTYSTTNKVICFRLNGKLLLSQISQIFSKPACVK